MIITLVPTGKRRRSYTVEGYKKRGSHKGSWSISGHTLQEAVKESFINILNHYEIPPTSVVSANLQNNRTNEAILSIVFNNRGYQETRSAHILFDDIGCPIPLSISFLAANQ